MNQFTLKSEPEETKNSPTTGIESRVGSSEEAAHQEAVEQKKEKRIWSSWWVKAIGASLVVLCFLPEVFYTIQNSHINDDVQALRTMGVPTTASELPPIPKAPANAEIRRAADMILQDGPTRTAYKSVQAADFVGRYMTMETPGGAYNGRWEMLGPAHAVESWGLVPHPASAIVVAPALAQLQSPLDLARNVAEQNSNQNIYWAEDSIAVGKGKDLKVYGGMAAVQEPAHLLYSAGLVELQTEKLAQARRDLNDAATILRNARFAVDVMPTTDHSLIHETAIYGARDMLPNLWLAARKMKGQPQALDILVEAATRLPSPPNTAQAMTDNMAAELDYYKEFQKNPFANANNPSISYLNRGGHMHTMFTGNKFGAAVAVRRAAHEWREIFEYARAHPDDYGDLSQRVTAAGLRMDEEWPYHLLDSSFDIMPTSLEVNTVAELNYRLRLDAIRLLDYYAHNHAFPPSLAEFGDDARDPFNGKPLIYKHSSSGFLIRSVGADLKDNGDQLRGPDITVKRDVTIGIDLSKAP